MKIKNINTKVKECRTLTDNEMLLKFYKVKSKEVTKQLRYINSQLKDLSTLRWLRTKQNLSNMIIKDLKGKGIQLQLI
jgi:hypothetical protein